MIGGMLRPFACLFSMAVMMMMVVMVCLAWTESSTQHGVLQPVDLVDYDENQLTFSSSSSSTNFHRRLEPDPLKSAHSTLHRCRDAGEAYSASYLIHKEHLIHQHTGYHLKWVNCEMASFIMMNARVHHLKNGNGSVLQSVDVLDFSVIHLSTFERLLHRWRWHNKMVDKDKQNLTAIHEAAHYLGQHTTKMHKMNIGLRHEAMNRTVVIMPFLLSDMGAGHSNLINRQAYLAACVWSFYEYYPYVTVAVKSQRDYDYVRYVKIRIIECESLLITFAPIEMSLASLCMISF